LNPFRSVFVFVFTFLLFWLGQFKNGNLPPLGKLFNPFTGLWQNAESSNQKIPETLHLKGLIDEVEILFDERMVPHIIAQNTADLYFAQGYITAFHRLWQMDFQTRVAEGRLSEIFGSKLIPVDREYRRLGLAYAADKTVAYLSDDTQSFGFLKSYALGVNAYIATLEEKCLPLEYKLLDYRPEPWTPFKTAVVQKYMAKRLACEDRDLYNSNALHLMGPELFQKLYRRYWPGDSPIIPGTQENKFLEIPPAEYEAACSKESFEYLPEIANFHYGSNNWAVSPSKTENRHPILCNDPHLALSLPAIWYEIHLMTPQMNVYGVSIPGSPMVTIGANDSIAWGVTNASRDVRDYYKITFKDKNRNSYKLDEEWKNAELIIETIKVKNGSTFYDTVRYTVHGPMMYDESFPANQQKENIALSWTALYPSNELLALYKLNTAQNYDDFQEALNHYQCPAQNFIFASVKGDIAIREQGKFPAYKNEEGRFIQAGDKSNTLWQNFIPNDKNPSSLNPVRGFVSSANQHPTDENYPYPYDGNFEYYRNRRINSVLGDSYRIKVADMQKLQKDNYNLMASEILPLLLSYINPTDLNKSQQRYYNRLLSWKYNNDPAEAAAAIFEQWWNQFYQIFWEKLLSYEYKLDPPGYYPTYLLLKNINAVRDLENNELFPSHLEDIKIIALETFRFSADKLNKWEKENGTLSWAKYKDTGINHLAKIPAFSALHIPIGGNKGIVNATGKEEGPGWRMITELLPEGVKIHCIFAGGQSGNPASPFYDNFVYDWAEGNYYDALFTRDYNRLHQHSSYKQLMLPL